MMRTRITRESESGFTILELMIATTAFSVILLACAFALIQIGNLYYRGTIVSRTQTVARTVIDDIGSAIQYGDEAPQISTATTTSPGYVCVGPNRYTVFKLNTRVQNADHALAFDKSGVPCTANTTFTNAKELLGDNMRLTQFTVTPKPSAVAPTSYEIELNIIYGADDLFTGDVCNGGKGSQFCASAHLKTSVYRRKV